MLHLIASSCRLVELDQLFLIPLGGDEENETFKGNWQGLCVYEVAYAVFRGQSAVTTKRHSLKLLQSFVIVISPIFTSIC